MPLRLRRPYNGQNAGTLYTGTDESVLRSIGLADDYIELATNYVQPNAAPFRALASTFSTVAPAGSFITTLSNPFAGQGRGITTYATQGTVPPQIALSSTGRSLVIGASAGVAGTIYSVTLIATSGDGLLVSQPVTLNFQAVAQQAIGGGGAPASPFYAVPMAVTALVASPQGLTHAQIVGVPNGVTPTISSVSDGPNNGRFAVTGNGPTSALVQGATALTAAAVSVTLTAVPLAASLVIPVTAVATPTALLSAAYVYPWGVRRHTAGYNGPAIQVSGLNSSGARVGTPFDVSFPTTDVGAFIDPVAVFAAAVTQGGVDGMAEVTGAYAQNSSGVFFPAPNIAPSGTNQGARGPLLLREKQSNGRLPLSVAGNREYLLNSTPANTDGPDRYLMMPTGVTTATPPGLVPAGGTNRNNYANFLGLDPHNSRDYMNYYSFGTAGTTSLMQMVNNPSIFSGLAVRGGVNFDSLLPVRSQTSVIGHSSTPTEQRIYVREQEVVFATPQTSGGLNTGGFLVGGAVHTGQTALYSGSFEAWGGVLCMGAGLNSTDAKSLVAYMTGYVGAPTQFTSRLIIEGNSLDANRKGMRDYLGTQYWIEKAGLIGNPEKFNCGVCGAKFVDNSGGLGLYSNATYFGYLKGLVATSLRCVVAAINLPGNDFLNQQTAADTYAAAINYKADLRAINPNVKILMGIEEDLAGAAPGQSLAWKNLVQANTGNFDGIIDPTGTGPGAIGTSAYNNPAWYSWPTTAQPVDVHKNSFAIGLVEGPPGTGAAISATAINAQLVGTV